ncbi:DUF4013 domain-containing protein [Halomicroarcula limicola]|uniref:DUF4013 domain-containing protein n=1 Tax=Haloarcula limicola TaxID=1429915 RepID=A0A8J8C3C2_9EURY|nr:DUF4013 domain-containing protein [Halomicroarcula limicola]MBV0924341.1 DUF4013 domain-containing protein [Halomicroarcula limicola]
MPHCTACGAAVSTTDAFCPQCGLERHEPSDEAAGADAVESGEIADTRETTESRRRVDMAGERDATAEGDAGPYERGSLSFGLYYPSRAGYEPFLLGSIVALLGAVIPFVGLFTYGYVFRLIEWAANGRADPPEFDEFGRLFVDGLRLAVATAVLAVVTAVVGATVAAVTEQAGLAGPLSDFAVALTALAGLYVTPAVLTAYAVTGRITRAFTGRYAGAFALSTHYLAAFAGSLVLGFAATMLWVASLLTLVGPVFVSTYASYVFAAFWGYQYRAAAEAGTVPKIAPDADDSARTTATETVPARSP